MNAAQILDREFLEIRARLIEVAAALDRLDRGEGSLADDPRVERINQAIEVLRNAQPDRAERVQLLFSIPYEEGWRQQMSLTRS